MNGSERKNWSLVSFCRLHDELLVEAKKEEVEEVKRILTEEMRGAADSEIARKLIWKLV